MMAEWTATRIARLKELYDLGYTASQIAIQLGGVTRNAVISKVHRLSLNGTARRAAKAPTLPVTGGPGRPRKPREEKARAQSQDHGGGVGINLARGVGKAFAKPKEAAPAALPPEPTLPQDSHQVTLLARTTQQCAWPIGETCGPDTLMCGSTDKADILEPYCRYHRGIAGGRPASPVARLEKAVGAAMRRPARPMELGP